MKKIAVLFIVLCAAAVLGPALFADDLVMPRFEIPSARTYGMGGTHVAYTDNVFSLLVNPAAMMRTEQRSFFAISLSGLNPSAAMDILSLYSAFSGALTSGKTDNLLKAMSGTANVFKKGKIVLGADLREFPLSIAWVADGFGFGLWDRAFLDVRLIGTHVETNFYTDVILPFGLAFKILDTGDHIVDTGFTLKPFTRIKTGVQGGLSELSNNLNKATIPMIMGAGLDMGLQYRWNMGLSLGLTFDDIVTRGVVTGNFLEISDANSYYVPFSLNAGAAYDFKIGQYWQNAPDFLAKTGFTLAFDWRDLTNLFQQDDYTKRNAVLDMGAGVQFSLGEVFNLRAGLSEMLPAVGLGIDAGPLKFDVAYYGKELGLEPGQLSVSAVDLTLAIRPGAKKRDWPWTRRSLVGLISGDKAEAVEAEAPLLEE